MKIIIWIRRYGPMTNLYSRIKITNWAFKFRPHGIGSHDQLYFRTISSSTYSDSPKLISLRVLAETSPEGKLSAEHRSNGVVSLRTCMLAVSNNVSEKFQSRKIRKGRSAPLRCWLRFLLTEIILGSRLEVTWNRFADVLAIQNSVRFSNEEGRSEDDDHDVRKIDGEECVCHECPDGSGHQKYEEHGKS